MDKGQIILFWVTIGSYLLASLFYIGWLGLNRIFGKKAEKIFLFTGFLANAALIFARTIEAGQAPVRTLYELNMVVAWLTVGVYVIARRVYDNTVLVGLVCLPFAFLVMGWGYADNPAIEPLTAAYKSNWLVVHVLFALLSTACYIFASGSSVLLLIKDKYPHANNTRLQLVPDEKKLDRVTVKLVLVGFLAGTVMLISGSIWAKLLWGTYWGWDPVETWSLLSWLVYGVYLHLHFTFGWRGKKLAWLCLGCLITNIISFWAVGLVTPDTYHNLELITRPVD